MYIEIGPNLAALIAILSLVGFIAAIFYYVGTH